MEKKNTCTHEERKKVKREKIKKNTKHIHTKEREKVKRLKIKRTQNAHKRERNKVKWKR